MSEAKNVETSPATRGSVVERFVIWRTCEPPEGILLMLKCGDFMGEYTMKATRVDYKKPKKGENPKNFRRGWRWIKENGETISRKEKPSAWDYI